MTRAPRSCPVSSREATRTGSRVSLIVIGAGGGFAPKNTLGVLVASGKRIRAVAFRRAAAARTGIGCGCGAASTSSAAADCARRDLDASKHGGPLPARTDPQSMTIRRAAESPASSPLRAIAAATIGIARRAMRSALRPQPAADFVEHDGSLPRSR